MKVLQHMRSNEKGFTLIELLVVIAIIGILATIVIINVAGARNKANDARVQSDLRAIMNALELTISDTNALPTVAASCGAPGQNNTIFADNTGVICSGNAIGTVLVKIPSHPTAGVNYRFTTTGGTNYTIQGILPSAPTKNYSCSAGTCSNI